MSIINDQKHHHVMTCHYDKMYYKIITDIQSSICLFNIKIYGDFESQEIYFF